MSRFHKKLSMILGAGLWILGGVLLTWSVSSDSPPSIAERSLEPLSPTSKGAGDVGREKAVRPESQVSRGSEDLWNYLCNRQRYLELQLPGVPLEYGDPVFERGSNGQWNEVGYVTTCDDNRVATRATVLWYGEDRFENSIDHSDETDSSLEAAVWSYHASQGRISEVVQTLLPAEQRMRLEALLREAMDAHAEEITALVTPFLVASIEKSLPVIEQGFSDSMNRHRKDIESLGERYEQAVLREKLVPLLREEIFPIVKMHGQPLAEKIGKQLWDRASFWRFGWRALYDRTPLPERDLLRREWERFVEQEAVPVFESHTPEIIDVQRRILIDVSQNKNVRAELRELASDIIEDAELRRLVTSILRESIVENQELRNVWSLQWQTDEAKAVMSFASDRLEPLARKIGDEILGTREEGITPSFARVLRSQILGKDRRWISVERQPKALHESVKVDVIAVVASARWEPYPLVIMAGAEHEFPE